MDSEDTEDTLSDDTSSDETTSSDSSSNDEELSTESESGFASTVSVLLRKELSVLEKASTQSRLNTLLKNLINLGYNGVQSDSHGKTPLHYAAKHGYMETVTKVLNAFKDVCIDDHIFRLPLHIDKEVGGTLFDEFKLGRSHLLHVVNKRDSEGKTAVCYAVEGEHYEIVCSLILHGANVYYIPCEIQKGLLRYLADPNNSITFCNFEELRRVIGLLALKVPDALSHFSEDVEYPHLLSFYFDHGHIKVIDSLLRSFGDPEKTKKLLNTTDNSILPIKRINDSDDLCDMDHLKAVKYILENGAKNSINNISHVVATLTAAELRGHVKTSEFCVSILGIYKNLEHFTHFGYLKGKCKGNFV